MHKDVERILITEQEIKTRIAELAKTLTEDYKGKEVLFVCILRGAVVFFADLVRAVDLEVEFDFMSVSSYGAGASSSGEVRILKDMSNPIEGKHIIIIEDIIDSGRTLYYLVRLLKQRNPASIKVCSFLDKPDRREVPFYGDYVGFSIPNEFVVGYGMDYNEKYRDLPDLCVLKRSIYE